MPKFPNPPPGAVLAGVPPHWRGLPPGTLLFRAYFQGGTHPVAWSAFRHFGPIAGRFEHHEPPPRTQERGILYAATGVMTGLAEAFQARRAIEPWPTRHSRSCSRTPPSISATGS